MEWKKIRVGVYETENWRVFEGKDGWYSLSLTHFLSEGPLSTRQTAINRAEKRKVEADLEDEKHGPLR